MAAKAPDAPVTESKRQFDERRKKGLEQAKALKAGTVGLFGDIGVVHVPPPPEKEEPPHDERPSAEDIEIERAYQDASSPPSLADVAAVEAMAGAAEEEPSAEDIAAYERGEIQELDGVMPSEDSSVAEALEASDALEAAEGMAVAVAAMEREERAILGEPEPAEDWRSPSQEEREASQNTPEEPEILGPESFGGSDEESHLMSQTSAARLREEMAVSGAEASPALLPEGVPFERLEVSGKDAEFIESKTLADVSPAPAGFSLFGHNLFGDEVKAKSTGPLSDRFKLPPFTVFDARQGAWQDRKRAWLALGIQSEVGRGENLLNMSDTVLEPDPVKRAEMVAARERRNKSSAFGQEFVLGAQPGIDGAPGGQGKSWHTKDTGLSRKLAPGGGGGGAWIGGPKTSSSEKFGREGEADVVLDENGQPLASKTGTSIFDPVLTELLYSWFVPPAGDIFDPFAGGSVRGIVASKLGRRYVGIELRGEQIAANERQAAKICQGDAFQPTWIEGDSTNAAELTEGAMFDFVMACPPYGDLEQYSEDPRDLSNMTYEAFAEAYSKIIAAALARLKPDRFAYFVIGDIRDDKGFYRGLPELTVRAFEEAGAKKYNEAILVTSVGSLPIRISKQFGRGRKLGKTHQNVLGFVKGDPFRAAEACGGQAELTL